MTERIVGGVGFPTPISQQSESARGVGAGVIVPIFFCTLVCSSALLFFVEPMFAKLLLPLLGGTPGVWNTCMVCFQALLLAAYAFGHWSIGRLGVKRQTVVQILLLSVAALALPVALPRGCHPPAGGNPILWVMENVIVAVGLPFFAVATTAPVMQRWFSATGHRAGSDPYFLYAASNLGSLAALIAYPILVEPRVGLRQQAELWSIGYAGLVALTAACALFVRPQPSVRKIEREGISWQRRGRWILMAMIPSSLLLGTTTFLTTDIAAVPMLWIVPLVIYLLSFIFVFSSRQILPHRLMMRLQPVCVLWVALFMLGRVGQPVWMVLAVHLGCLFVSSMACHGELAKDRPSAGRLTDFYLMMALGGVLGGLFNALAAPLLFNGAVEYPVALIAACWVCGRRKISGGGMIVDFVWPVIVGTLAWGVLRATASEAISARMLAVGVAVMMAGLALAQRRRFVLSLAALFLVGGAEVGRGEVLLARRSFFGIHRVVRNPDGPFNDIYHGTTVHGREFVDSAGRPVRATTPLAYYSRSGPIGEILAKEISANPRRRISVVGLGVGSLAAYAQGGTRITYYEIDPAVRWIARDSGYFSYLKSAQDRGADVKIVMGDARLTLGSAVSKSSDVLVIDAFSGDAVPVHLLTRQAMRIYLDKLDRGGILAFHISNMYLNLLPVCAALASDGGCAGFYRNDLDVSPEEAMAGKSASQWVVMAREAGDLGVVSGDSRWKPLKGAGQRVWTDDFSDIFSVFQWR